MASTIFSPQRARLLKTVERAFVRAGWTVDRPLQDSHDFRVDCGALNLLVKCVDESRTSCESGATIRAKLERLSQGFRSGPQRQLIVVFDWNFLSIEMKSRSDQTMVALTADDLASVTSLAAVSDRSPGAVDEWQAYLLERCLDYAVFVSKLHHKNRDYAAAIKWGRHAVEHRMGYTYAYLSLFWVLKDAGEWDAAVELGEKILVFEPDNTQFLRGMEYISSKRGDPAEAAEWRRRATDPTNRPRSLDDILAKQRLQANPQPNAGAVTPAPTQRPAKFGLAWLLRGIRRSSAG